MNDLFRDRAEAGQLLAPRLRTFSRDPNAIVLSLPRGGVVVGFEVARELRLPSDILVVRKLGVPGQEELAMGAIASGGVEFLDQSIVATLGITEAALAAVVGRERAELERRERVYRGSRHAPDVRDKTVILVDDGIATGSTMQAAVQAVQSRQPRAIVVAVPVASTEAVAALRPLVASVVTVLTSDRLFAIGQYYRNFRQVTDDEVRALLAPDARPNGNNQPAVA